MSEGRPPPDFAMVRAVEILAKIAEKRLKQPNVPPPPIDVPVILFNENVRFQIGVTKRTDVVRALGTGFGFIGNNPSRCNFLRASLRARRTASAFSRARFSDGFS